LLAVCGPLRGAPAVAPAAGRVGVGCGDGEWGRAWAADLPRCTRCTWPPTITTTRFFPPPTGGDGPERVDVRT